MIYKVIERDPVRSSNVHKGMFLRGLAVHNDITEDSEWSNFKVLIPKAHARLETDKKPKIDDIESVDCYEIIIFLQIGSSRNQRDTFVLCRFPGCKNYFKVIVHATGGASFEKSEHKLMIRVTDELDRRIVLGFCQKYSWDLITSSYRKTTKPDYSLKHYAYHYTCKDMPIRLKSGPTGNRHPELYTNLMPYEESSPIHTIFDNVVFLAT